MDFKTHLELKDKHAFLSPSKYHWVNYDEEKLVTAFQKYTAAQRGTELHALAKKCIELGVRLPETSKTLNMYVNDAIGFKLTPEVTLKYSDNCFGTADTIGFWNDQLRIHDLKTGETPTSMKQLELYAALFCFEYHQSPTKIGIELRIYQLSKVVVHQPDPNDIVSLMEKIITFDKLIEKLKTGE